MKYLAILLFAQMVFSFFIYTELTSLTESIVNGQPEANPQQRVEETTHVDFASAQSRNNNQSLDETRIRQIFREEISHVIDELALSSREAPQQGEEPENLQRETSLEQLQVVIDDLNHYASVGYISQRDMATLQIKIASLDPQHRTEMLKKLTRLLSSGELEGML